MIGAILRNYTVCLVLFGFCFVLSPSDASSGNSKDTILATVDEKVVTLSELKLAIASLPKDYQEIASTSMSQMMLQQLVDLKLFSKLADNAQILDNEEYVNEVSFLIEQLKRDHYLRGLYSKNVTNQAIRDRYQLLISNWIGADEVNARHILLKTREEAAAVIKRIHSGENFSKLAEEVSIGPTAKNGGNLGFFKYEAMVPEFAEAAFSLSVGEISAPVKTKFGWHVILVDEKRLQMAPVFETVRVEIEEELQRESLSKSVLEARKGAAIKIYDMDLAELLKGN